MSAIGPNRRGGTERVFVSAFGKHPGWDDHIDDIGLDTDRLVELKRTLYVQGIGRNIDSGSWDELEPAHDLGRFAHEFVWRIGPDLFIGRLWSSRDGKGRTKYPMIVCVHCAGLPVGAALRVVRPALEEVERQCRATDSAATVRAIIESTRTSLRAALAAPDASDDLTPARCVASVAAIAGTLSTDGTREGLHRTLYQIDREMGAYVRASGDSRTRSQVQAVRPAHMRVPPAPGGRDASFLAWLGFLFARLDWSTPLLLLAPLDAEWVDVIVGQPTSSQFFCTRANVERLPLSTSIPYSLSEAFVAEADAFVDAAVAGRLDVSAPPSGAKNPPREARPPRPARTSAPGGRPSKRNLLLIIAAAAVLLAVIVGLVLTRGGSPEPSPPPTPDDGSGGAPVGWATPDDAAQWDRLCREHEAWLEILLRRFRDPIFAAQRGAWSGDADGLGRVAEVIAAAERGERLLSPVRVAGRDDIAEMLRADPPAAAMTADGVRRTKEALAGVDEIRAVLTGANWPLHATFERLAGRYDQLGRPALAAVLRDRLTDVSRLDRDLFQAATRLLDVAPSVKALDGLVEQVFDARARIEGALDPSCRPDVVAAVLVPHLPEPGAAVDDAAHGAIAQGLLPDMVWIDRVNTRLDAFDGVVAIDTLRTDAPSVLPTSYDDGRAIQAWLTVVGDYEVDPDAVRSLDAVRTEPGLTAIRDNLDRLRRLATTSEGDRSRIETNIETSARGLAAIESDIEAARTIPPIRRNAARIDDALREITEAVATTRTEVTTLLAEVGNPADWRAAICATDARYRIEALNRWWIVLRDDFCGRISADDLRADTDLYVASYGRFGDWSVWLGLIDERLAVDLASLASGDRAAVARAAQAAREQAVTAILGAPDPKADPPPREDPDWLARIEAQRTALDAWVVDGASALETLASVEALLDLGYGFDDEPADGSSTVRARIDDAKAAHTTFDAMRAARPEVAARLDDLEAIAGLTATPALVERAITTVYAHPEAAIAAWRRLGEPARVASTTIMTTAQVRDHVLGIVARMADGARRGALEREVMAAARARWFAHAAAQHDASSIEAAIGAMGAFGIRVDDPELSGPTLVNVLLHDLRRRAATGLSDDACREAIGTMIDAIDARVDAAVTARPEVATLLVSLRDLRTGEGPPPGPRLDPATIGPGAAGFAYRAESSDPAGGRLVYGITFRGAGRDGGDVSHELVFRLVRPSDGGAAFVATRETSVGFVGDLARAKGRTAELLAMIAQGTRRPGPLAWDWHLASGGPSADLEPGYTWVKAIAGANTETPSASSPMQWITPAAASLIAELAGCRLPSVDEWRSAYAIAGAGTPNLRDATWYDELDAVLAKQDQGESVPLPDEGVFKAGPAAAGPRIAAAQAERTTERDGWLWFRPVDDGDGSTFVDLVGNVAEFVRSGDRQRVIGASALSPRSTEATEPLGTHDDLAYCDVGFRLAFSADERALLPPSRCDRLVALLEATRFIGEQ